VVEPESLGLERAMAGSLRGGDAPINAALARRVVEGERGPHRDIVLLNAAAGIAAAGLASGLADGLEAAVESIDSGRAGEVLRGLVEASRAAAEEDPPTP
jgi:anthranilate phosphoribosyltransferase